MKAVITFFLFLFIASSICYAEIYKWVDERGKVHYSQTPPNDSAEKIKVKSGDGNAEAGTANNTQSTTSSVENQKKYSDFLEQERLERKEQREQKKQQQAKARERCFQTRAELDDMNQGGILYYELDKDGERQFVDESRIEARKNKLRDYLRRNCGGI